MEQAEKRRIFCLSNLAGVKQLSVFKQKIISLLKLPVTYIGFYCLIMYNADLTTYTCMYYHDIFTKWKLLHNNYCYKIMKQYDWKELF